MMIGLKDFVREKIHGRVDRVLWPMHFMRGDILIVAGQRYVLRRAGRFADENEMYARIVDPQLAKPISEDQIDHSGWFIRPKPEVDW